MIRAAKAADIPAIITLFASDEKGGHGDSLDIADFHHYVKAFEAITLDENSRLFVAEFNGHVVGTAQVTLVIGMSGKGARRGRISGVEVREDLRSKGIGKQLIEACLAFIKKEGVRHAFLASNKNRPRAHSFYKRLGFSQSIETSAAGI